MVALRAAPAPLLIAPQAEPPHLALNIGPTTPQPGATFVVRHIDVVQTGREVDAATTAAVPATSASRT